MTLFVHASLLLYFSWLTNTIVPGPSPYTIIKHLATFLCVDYYLRVILFRKADWYQFSLAAVNIVRLLIKVLRLQKCETHATLIICREVMWFIQAYCKQRYCLVIYNLHTSTYTDNYVYSYIVYSTVKCMRRMKDPVKRKSTCMFMCLYKHQHTAYS